MRNDVITIDVDELREDLREECLGAYFGGGYGAAMVEAVDVDHASPEELVQMAIDKGFDLRRYQVDD